MRRRHDVNPAQPEQLNQLVDPRDTKHHNPDGRQSYASGVMAARDKGAMCASLEACLWGGNQRRVELFYTHWVNDSSYNRFNSCP